VGDEASRQIELRRAIADAIGYYARYQPAWALGLEQRLTAYRAARERLHLTEEGLHHAGARPLLCETLPAAVIGVLGAPLAVFGWLLNVPPRLVTDWIAKRLVREPSQLATYEFWIGLQAFAVLYAICVLALRHFTDFGRLELALAVLLFPLIGYLSSRYFGLMRHYSESLRLASLQLLLRGRLEQLRFWRQQLARDQEKMRDFMRNPEPRPD
jgi:hypothetical protein